MRTDMHVHVHIYICGRCGSSPIWRARMGESWGCHGITGTPIIIDIVTYVYVCTQTCMCTCIYIYVGAAGQARLGARMGESWGWHGITGTPIIIDIVTYVYVCTQTCMCTCICICGRCGSSPTWRAHGRILGLPWHRRYGYSQKQKKKALTLAHVQTIHYTNNEATP